MRTLDRYIAVRLTAHFCLTLAALAAGFAMVALMEEMGEIGTGTYDFRQALRYVGGTLPAEAYGLFPAAALIGTMTGLRGMAGASEILAMWAGGISKARFTWAVMQWALAVMVAVVLGGELIAAPLAQRAGTERSAALSGGMGLAIAHRVWARDQAAFINIGTVEATGELHDVFIYEFDESRRLRRFGHAAGAVYDNGQWTLEDLTEQEIGEGGVTPRHVASRAWPVRLTRKQLRALLIPPQDLSIAQLHQSIASLRERQQDARRYEQAFWGRVTMPLSTGAMVLLAIPFVITAPPRSLLGLRLVAAVLAGIGFQLFAELVGDFGFGYGVPPYVSAALPAALATGVAVRWMRHAY